MPLLLTAEEFVKRIKSHGSEENRKVFLRFFKAGPGEYGEGDVFIGVRMAQLRALTREFIEMSPGELEKLLLNPIHEVRGGALSIMDRQARRNKTPESRRKELFELYLKRIDRINNWDLVDVSCAYVVGRYLFDKQRTVLYKLARSENMWARRTAIVSTGYFLKHGDSNDTYQIAEILLGDKEDLIHKATGWLLRAAGDRDQEQLFDFLGKYAATMPRTALRYALEHVDKPQRDHFMQLKKGRVVTSE